MPYCDFRLADKIVSRKDGLAIGNNVFRVHLEPLPPANAPGTSRRAVLEIATMTALPPGEVLRSSRGYTVLTILSVPTGLLLFSAGVVVVLVASATAPPLELGRLLYVLGGLGFLEGSAMLWGGWYLATHKPYLILGAERLQYWEGPHQRWDVCYDDLVDIAAFSPAHPLFGFRMTWLSCLGLRLAHPEAFDKDHPRLARRRQRCRRQNQFDLSVLLVWGLEPPERSFEAVLRCYHSYKDDTAHRA
jgi:hypothetical protein